MMFFAILISSWGTHDRIATLAQPPARRESLGEMVRDIFQAWSQRSFLFLTLSGVATSMALGLNASMNFYINTYFWGLTAAQISLLAAGVVVSAFVALNLAPLVSRRIGKRAAAIWLMGLSVVISLTPMTARLLGLMPPNHTTGVFVVVMIQSVLAVALGVAGQTLISAMIADVVEEGELRTGRRSEGVYFSASIMVSKAVSGLGIFAASGLLGLIAFPTGVNPDHIPAAVLVRLALAYAPAYAGLYIIGFILMSGYKITRASHAATLEKLAARAAAAAE
jgi:Na+/melibiose symporter-like transporter